MIYYPLGDVSDRPQDRRGKHLHSQKHDICWKSQFQNRNSNLSSTPFTVSIHIISLALPYSWSEKRGRISLLNEELINERLSLNRSADLPRSEIPRLLSLANRRPHQANPYPPTCHYPRPYELKNASTLKTTTSMPAIGSSIIHFHHHHFTAANQCITTGRQRS